LAGDAEATLADIARIRSHLGWEAEVTFAAGLAAMKQRMKAGLE
jgi:nucleoside-diphosphate-sugar epimerase